MATKSKSKDDTAATSNGEYSNLDLTQYHLKSIETVSSSSDRGKMKSCNGYENGVYEFKKLKKENKIEDLKQNFVAAIEKDPFAFQRQQLQHQPIPELTKYSSSKMLFGLCYSEQRSQSIPACDNLQMNDTIQELPDLIIEVDAHYRPEEHAEVKKSSYFSYENYPGAGTFYGGGPRTIEKALDDDAKWLRCAEIWYRRSDIMKNGHTRAFSHTRQVNAHWALIQTTLENEGFVDSNLRSAFQKFRNDALNKIREMGRTGAERIELSEAEKYIERKEKGNEGVVGIDVSDVGQIEETNVIVPVSASTSKYPKRKRKPRETYTFEPPTKTARGPVTPAYDQNLSTTGWQTPVPSPVLSSSHGSNQGSRIFTPILAFSPSTPSSSSIRNSGNNSDGELTIEGDDQHSVQEISDDEPSGTPLRQKAKKSTKKKSKGLDKRVSMGMAPLSKKAEFIQEEMGKLVDNVASTSKKMDIETDTRIKLLETQNELHRSLIPQAQELVNIQKQKLEYEAEQARHRAEKEKEEAAEAKARKEREEIQLEIAKLQLANLKKSSG